MSKLETLLKGTLAVLRNPSLLSAVLYDQRYWKRRFHDKFGHVNPLPKIPLSAFIPDEAVLDSYDFGGDTSTIPDILLLKHLAMLDDVSSYLEIGTWRGATAAVVAPHVEQVVTIDLDEKTMRKRGYGQDVITQIGRDIQGVPNVKQLRSDTMTLDFSSLGDTFDLIFIDGDHRADHVCSDTENVLTHLCHENTIVVWHDYGVDPENVRWEVYYGIMNGLSADFKSVYHVANTKCAFAALAGVQGELREQERDRWSVSIKRN